MSDPDTSPRHSWFHDLLHKLEQGIRTNSTTNQVHNNNIFGNTIHDTTTTTTTTTTTGHLMATSNPPPSADGNATSVNSWTSLMAPWTAEEVLDLICSTSYGDNGGKSKVDAREFKDDGNAEFKRGRYTNALEMYSLSLSMAPLPSPRDGTGATGKGKDKEEGSSIIRSSIQEESLYIQALGNRATTLFYLQSYREALEDCDRVLQCASTHGKTLFRKGKCLQALGDLKQAQECYDQVLTLGSAHSHPSILTKAESARSECTAPCIGSTIDTTSSSLHGTEDMVLFQPHPTISHASIHVDVKETPAQGRYMVNSSPHPLLPGDVVVSETPYAFVLAPTHHGTRCHHCACLLPRHWIPCTQCIHTRYCNERCRSLAWQQYHVVECNASVCDEAPIDIVLGFRVYLRSILPGTASAQQNDEKDTSTTTTTTTTTTSTPTPPPPPPTTTTTDGVETEGVYHEGHPFIWRAGLASVRTLRVPTTTHTHSGTAETDPLHWSAQLLCAYIRHHHPTLSVSVSVQELYTCLTQVETNSYAVTAWQEVQTTRVSQQREIVGDCQDNVAKKEQVRLGLGLYLTGALLNHSCRPNTAISYIHGTQLIIRVTERIQSGGPVLSNYGPTSGDMPLSKRQLILQNKYGFTCRCMACQEESESTTATTTSTTTTSTTTPTSSTIKNTSTTIPAKIASTGHPPSAGPIPVLNTRLAFEQAMSLLDTAKAILLDDQARDQDLLKAEVTLLESLLLRKGAQAPQDITLGETYDLLAETLAKQREFARAARWCRKSIAVLSTLFTPNDAKLGHEYEKLATLCFNAKDATGAHAAISHGLAILSANYGVDYPVCQELKDMQSFLVQRGHAIPPPDIE